MHFLNGWPYCLFQFYWSNRSKSKIEHGGINAVVRDMYICDNSKIRVFHVSTNKYIPIPFLWCNKNNAILYIIFSIDLFINFQNIRNVVWMV